MKDVVSRVTGEKVLKAFLLKPHVVSTREAVVATRQAKLFMLVKSSMELRPPIPEKLEITDRHTQTRNTAINIIDYLPMPKNTL